MNNPWKKLHQDRLWKDDFSSYPDIPGPLWIHGHWTCSCTRFKIRQDRRITAKVQKIAAKMNRASVKEFYKYFVIWSLYAQLGVTSYQKSYKQFMRVLGDVCSAWTGAPCATNVTSQEAIDVLSKYADSPFSSINTASFPLFLFDKDDGNGNLFKGNEPLGGSEIDMSKTLLSATAHFDLENAKHMFAWHPKYNGGKVCLWM